MSQTSTCTACLATVVFCTREKCECGGSFEPTSVVFGRIRQLERELGELRATVMGACCVECCEQLGLDWTRGKDHGVRHLTCALEGSLEAAE